MEHRFVLFGVIIYLNIHITPTVTPLSLAHFTIEDDTYNGYFVRKNTTVFANVWFVDALPSYGKIY